MSTELAGAVLPPAQWQPLEAEHQTRVRPLVEPRLERRRRGEKHPIDDFLFEYYRLSPGQLLTWHPGWRHSVLDHPDLSALPTYSPRDRGFGASRDVPASRRAHLRRAIALLRATAARDGAYGCFGLHEWAMVYRSERHRHQQVPLRVTPEQIIDTVEGQGLRCTHFDAYRFFTVAAQREQSTLTRADQIEMEQPACLHAGMDLYRFAYSALPLISSDLVVDCFEHARAAREVDMRASPYDLQPWDLEPIAVDTVDGRRDYVRLQRDLSARAQRLRQRLLAELQAVQVWLDSAQGATGAAVGHH